MIHKKISSIKQNDIIFESLPSLKTDNKVITYTDHESFHELRIDCMLFYKHL